MTRKFFAALMCCLFVGSIAHAQTTVDLRDMIARTAPASVAVKTKSNLPGGILDQASRLDRLGEFGSRLRLPSELHDIELSNRLFRSRQI